MSLDNTIWLVGIFTESAVVGLLLYRRVWRLLPVFCLYCLWDLASNAAGFLVQQFFPGSYNPSTYFGQIVIDSILQFGVLVELSWSVLRPIRGSLPRFIPLAIGAVILMAGAAIWPFAALSGLADTSSLGRLIGHLQQTVSILRILFFVVLAGCSQLLSIGLRDRELQVATGLGFYSLVSLGMAMLITRHQTTAFQFKHFNQVVIASFLCTLIYWVFSFAQKEAERRAFNPQMQNMLLAVAGVARADRIALRESSALDLSKRR